MGTFITDRPELQPLVDHINEAVDQKGYFTMDDLTGNGDTQRGFLFHSQEEADKFLDAYHEFFPRINVRWGDKINKY